MLTKAVSREDATVKGDPLRPICGLLKPLRLMCDFEGGEVAYILKVAQLSRKLRGGG